MLNNRELAILVWVAALAMFGLSRPGFRENVAPLARQVANPTILLPLAAYVAYLTAWAWLGAHVGAWNLHLVKPTLIWFAGSGLALSFNSVDIHHTGRIRRTLFATVGVSVFVEYLVGMSLFAFWFEFALLQPVLALLVLVVAVADLDSRLATVRRAAKGMLAVLGGSLIAYSAWQVAADWTEIDKTAEALEFMLPFWLTAAAIPFLVVLNVWGHYQAAFARIDHFASDLKARWRAKGVFLVRMNVRVSALADLAGPGAVQVARAGSLRDAWNELSVLLAERKVRRQAARAQADRLRRFTDVDGVDERGLRLDQREFRETKEALVTIAVAQMGWHPRGDRYRPELLETLESSFRVVGLATPSGIRQQISRDGQSWYAWRRTVSGWCLAIGAVGPPPDQWFYDGPGPPSGFPGFRAGWAKSAHFRTPNWE